MSVGEDENEWMERQVAGHMSGRSGEDARVIWAQSPSPWLQDGVPAFSPLFLMLVLPEEEAGFPHLTTSLAPPVVTFSNLRGREASPAPLLLTDRQ